MIRPDGRPADELRPTTITLGAQTFAEGSVLIESGQTRVLCAVSVEEGVPQFMRGAGRGWVTAEYGMLPRSTVTRNPRESKSGRPRGRSQEIERLIGRSLRAVVDLEKLGEITLTVDCDVLQADGGTRTTAITGAYVALYQALDTLKKRNKIRSIPLSAAVAATSVGLIDGQVILDLCYEEDFRADADFNLVLTDAGELVEVQGTGERGPFSRDALDQVLETAIAGAARLFEEQRRAIGTLSQL